ncbi:Hypothetical protein SYNTR_1752 [Candidatus Syntrophocurvum alkaliphilum]|uniref:Polymerase nucleotidyl transferase domain-containing protein n=1 Tax=Candidatus Syntrophocurvum alkaliphilum TaxID=2293317 RepID=A0A6I6DE00_9FIRM|nr:nucleotidyltransferase family protein [Candidatus Syntrophocurvum alkaliphilum]QGU00346.1 Hypothetical protein SYNTR_1752 [Candidatus Syntrophocurvum alkaliphilum]
MEPKLNVIKQNKEIILKLAQKYGASNIRIFGSISRGEEHKNSDLDLLVDFDKDRTLFDMVGLKLELEELLGFKVDIATEKSLHNLIADQVKREAIQL